MEKPYCCTVGCDAPAEWGVWWNDKPDDYAHACTAHVGGALHVGRPNTVIHLNEATHG